MSESSRMSNQERKLYDEAKQREDSLPLNFDLRVDSVEKLVELFDEIGWRAWQARAALAQQADQELLALVEAKNDHIEVLEQRIRDIKLALNESYGNGCHESGYQEAQQTVPITPEMARAFSEALEPGGWDRADERQRLEVIENLTPAIEAMLAAAPAPQAESPQEPLTDEQLKVEWLGFNGPVDNPISLSDFECVVRAIERTLATRWGVKLKGDS